MDDTFVHSDSPLPEDFDFAFWNCAHPDLQMPHPMGNEEVTLTNLCPHDSKWATRDVKGNTLLRFILPGHNPFVLVRYEEGQMTPIAASLDTIIIEPEAGKVSCVYRLLIPVEPAVRVLEARLIVNDNPQRVPATPLGKTTSGRMRT